MSTERRCPTCNALQHGLDGEALKSLVGIESLRDGNPDGFGEFLDAIADERWEAAARILVPPFKEP